MVGFQTCLAPGAI